MSDHIATLERKARAVLSANDDFRRGMPDDWEGDPLQDACAELRTALEMAPSCGYSCNGVNLWGDKASIQAAMEAFHSHGQIEELRRNLRHWREEAGKLHARVATLVEALGKAQGPAQ